MIIMELFAHRERNREEMHAFQFQRRLGRNEKKNTEKAIEKKCMHSSFSRLGRTEKTCMNQQYETAYRIHPAERQILRRTVFVLVSIPADRAKCWGTINSPYSITILV
mmetsp:Transcript_40711/g.122619  ORF Transcript_40711/g.122619 Transcript_40711/m.122619 type:complete len:108 (-) Transcript_40711:438-761(-)